MKDTPADGPRRPAGYEYPAWCQMETALDVYAQDRAKYLSQRARAQGPEAEAELDRIQKASTQLLRGTSHLADLDPIEALMAFYGAGRGVDVGVDSTSDLLDEHVCINLGWEVMGMLHSARERFWQLLDVVRPLVPSKRSRAFLQRVSRCFLFGFDTESVVMCRAVLDTEFQAEIAADEVYAWWRTTEEGKKKSKCPLTLYARIEAANYHRRIGEEARKSAHEVRDKGNDAVHEKPTRTEALVIVRKTVEVLDALLN